MAVAFGVVVLSCLRLFWIESDFPAGLNWSGDLYTDEGWYSSGAVAFATTRDWLVRGDFNPVVNMPGLHVLLAGVFELAGVGLAQARFTIAAWSLWVILGTYLLVRRYAGNLRAGVAALLLSANFTFFAYSRLALNEIPMVGLVLFSILMLTKRPSRSHTATSAILYSAAILTKPTALFALPVLLYVISTRSRHRKAIAVDATTFLAIVTVLAGGYHLWARARFPADYLYFNSLNIDSRLSLDPGSLTWNALRTLWHALVLDPLLFPLALASAAWLLRKASGERGNPALWISILWMAGASLILLVSGYHPPRYFLPLAVPMVILVALVSVGPWQGTPDSIARLLVLISLVFNTPKTLRYLASPDYSFIRMANDIGQRARADGREDPILLGHLADSVGLVTGLRSINDRMGWMDLTEKLEVYSPDYYVSLGVYEGFNQIVSRDHELELLAVYDVFGNYYSGKQVYLYRISPRTGGD